MSAYRPLGPFPQFLLADGTVNNGGLIHFYQTDLTTLQDTWSDVGLTTRNSNPVVLDPSGRPTTDIWGSAAYGVVITDSLGANPRTFNNIQPDVGSGATIPSLVSGDFLTNNGSVLLWQAISQLPDPTGHAGQILFTDGTLDYWAPVPVPATPPITNTTSSVKIGTALIQWGTGSAPASGTTVASLSVSYPIAYSSNPVVFISPSNDAALSGGWTPICSSTSIGTTSFTARFNSNSWNPSLGNFVGSQAFQWVSIGTVPA
jgi:hypothetical protein